MPAPTPPRAASQAPQQRHILRWSIIVASTVVVLAAAGFFLAHEMWAGYAPGVYVTQPVEVRQRVTADLLKEIGPPPESDPQAPKTIKELGDGTSCFVKPLEKRQRIQWTDIGQCSQ